MKGATYARTLERGMELIGRTEGWHEVYLDHDLGGRDNIMPIVLMMESLARDNRPLNIDKIYVHTGDFDGAEDMMTALYPWYDTERVFVSVQSEY